MPDNNVWDAFEEGWKAYRRGDSLDRDNPHEEEDDEWVRWREGWESAGEGFDIGVGRS